MDIDDIFFNSFLTPVKEQEIKKISISQEDRVISQKKQKKLEPIEKFLTKLVDYEVYVNHKDQYTKNTSTLSSAVPQKFCFYYHDSSKSWSPGISIYIDHPAEIEIAIPNNPEEEGIVVIKVATHHPDAYLLEKEYFTFESACEALGKFLSRCTTKINREINKEIKDKKREDSSNKSFINQNNSPNLQMNSNAMKKIIKETPVLKEIPPQTIKDKLGKIFKTNDESLEE